MDNATTQDSPELCVATTGSVPSLGVFYLGPVPRLNNIVSKGVSLVLAPLASECECEKRKDPTK